jgi:kinetochore protein Mis12/MTW1
MRLLSPKKRFPVSPGNEATSSQSQTNASTNNQPRLITRAQRATMPQPTPESTAVLAEHLGYTPLTLVDDVINVVNELMYGGVSTLEAGLMSMPPDLLGFKTSQGMIRDTDDDGRTQLTEDEENELQKGVHQLETLWENAVDQNFDKFEIFVMRNLLAIEPDLVPWVRLDHHKDLDLDLPSADTLDAPNAADTDAPNAATADAMDVDNITTTTTTDTSPPPPPPLADSLRIRLRELRQKFLASLQFNLQLRAEKARNAALIAQLETLVSSLSPSHSGPATVYSHLSGASDIKDTALFVGHQKETVSAGVASLKPKYESLVQQLEKTDEEAKFTRPEAERQLYIEAMAKRHLELQRNLRLNAHGEVVGGDFEGAIGNDMEEVERLEKLAGEMQKGAR